MKKTDSSQTAPKAKQNPSPRLVYLFWLAMMLISPACNSTPLTPKPDSPGKAPQVNVTQAQPEPTATREPSEPLVVRNPSEWFPDPRSLATFKDVPLREKWTRTNAEEVTHWYLEDRAAQMFAEYQRLDGAGYWWDTDCQYEENLGISSGIVEFHLFRTSAGAQGFFNGMPEIYVDTFKRFNPDMTVTPLANSEQVGEEAFLFSSPLRACIDFEPKNRFLVFRRMNVVVVTGLHALALNFDGQLHTFISEAELQSKLMELGRYIDELILTEADQGFVLSPEQNTDSLTAAPVDSSNPMDYIAGRLECTPSGDAYSVYGVLKNSSERSIELEVTLDILEDGGYFSGTTETIELPANEETTVSFRGGYLPPDPRLLAPPDNPDTPEYEPDVWLESSGLVHEYSCEMQSTPTWGQ